MRPTESEARDKRTRISLEPWFRRSQRLQRFLDAIRLIVRLTFLTLIPVAVLGTAVLLDGPGQIFAVELVAVALLALIPAWIYFQYVKHLPLMYDEYVITLFRLQVDELAHLPAPARSTIYFLPWKREYEKLQSKTKDNFYRSKFVEVYGRRSTSALDFTREISRPRTGSERFSPVGLTTLILTLGWVFVLQPGSTDGIEISGISSANLPTLPYDALRFGFFGTYAFIVQDLLRRLYRRDLRTTAYASAAIRVVVVAMIVSTLGSLPWVGDSSQFKAIAFFIGFFPQAGIELLRMAIVTRIRRRLPSVATPMPLGRLQGLNFWYEARLLEEGIDDIQNLATCDLVDVLLRTRAPVARLLDWIDQAFLILHTGSSSEPEENDSSSMARIKGLQELGIRTATDLERIWVAQQKDPHFIARMTSALNENECSVSIVVNSILIALAGEQNLKYIRTYKGTSG